MLGELIQSNKVCKVQLTLVGKGSKKGVRREKEESHARGG